MQREALILCKFVMSLNFKFQDTSVYLAAITIIIVNNDKGNF